MDRLAISRLDHIYPDAHAQFGGKALGLARLARSGCTVPRAFAVAATSESPDRWHALAREQFLTEAESLLTHGSVAVRSSALVEDQPEHSYAGLFETVLDVGDPESVFSAAGRCIASAGSERVRRYADGDAHLEVGLVVQTMVTPRAAGVLFTRDPQGRDAGMVLEAVRGAGEALVSGHAEPERWRIFRTGLGTWEARREASSSNDDAILTEAEVVALADVGWRLDRDWSTPLDLEWAIPLSSAGADEPEVQWLQARPITGLVEPPRWTIERSVEGVDDGPVTVWSNWNVRETMPEPLHPLSWGLWRRSILPFLTENFFGVPPSSPNFEEVSGLDRIQGRIYFNLNALLSTPLVGGFMASALQKVDSRAGTVVTDLIESGVLTPRRLSGSRLRRALGQALNQLRALPRSLRALRPRTSRRRLEQAAKTVRARPAIDTMDDEALLTELDLWGSPESGALRDGMDMLTGALLSWMVAEKLFEPWPEAKELLAAGIEGNPTTEISARIDDLVEAARPLDETFADTADTETLLATLETTKAGERWLLGLRDFLAFAGQRGPREFDFAAKRWADDPSMVLELVRSGLAAPSREPVRARLRRLGEERQRAIDAAVAEAPFWKRPPMRFFARAVALLMPLREAPKHYGMHVFYRVRLAALELGARLAQRGVLKDSEEVFWLTLDELTEALREPSASDPELRERIVSRRAELDDFTARPAPDVVRSDGVPVDTNGAVAPPEGGSQGTGVSRGAAIGPVRVLREPDPTAIESGDVLVVAFADPGWTPLFPLASALVMEVGGTICHAAVVARELGIPAVFGVVNATSELIEGQMVEVNGSTGVVRVLEST